LRACLSRMRGNVHVLVLRGAGRSNASGLPGTPLFEDGPAAERCFAR
jgi:hypothetical protein